ncbi:MAG: WhiB family transcriptional regulator [Candidatus Saccharimonadales bacterium]
MEQARVKNNQYETAVTQAQRLAPEMAFVAIADHYHPEKESSDFWQLDARCGQSKVDADAFFPERGGSVRDAKKICGQCDVQAQCLEYALTNNVQFGVWGGTTEAERRRMRRSASARSTRTDRQ